MKRTNQATAAPSAVLPFEVVRNEEPWLVWDGRDVSSLTLDQLDEAFQRGDVGPATKVFTGGMSTWLTLGTLADLDDTSPELRPAEQGAPQTGVFPSQPGAEQRPARLPSGDNTLGRARRQLQISWWWTLGSALCVLLCAALYHFVTDPPHEGEPGVARPAQR